MINTLLNYLHSKQLSDLAGTNLAMTIPLSEALVNDILADRPASPVEELRVRLLDSDEAVLNLGIDAPIIGLTRRELRLKLNGTVVPGQQNWLHFDILGGLGFLDKPLLNVASNLLADKLPGGVKISSDRLSLNLVEMIRKSGNDFILPALAAARLNSSTGKLILNLHIQIKS